MRIIVGRVTSSELIIGNLEDGIVKKCIALHVKSKPSKIEGAPPTREVYMHPLNPFGRPEDFLDIKFEHVVWHSEAVPTDLHDQYIKAVTGVIPGRKTTVSQTEYVSSKKEL